MQLYPTLSGLLIAIVFFGFSIGFLIYSNRIIGKAKKIEILYPEDSDIYREKIRERDEYLRRLTAIWRISVIGEILCSIFGGYLLAGLAGAIMIPIIVSSDYWRNREPLQNSKQDPLVKIVSHLVYIRNRYENPQEKLNEQIQADEKRHEMNLEQCINFREYLSKREDVIGQVAIRLLSDIGKPST